MYAFGPGVSSGLKLVGCIAPLAMSAGCVSVRVLCAPKAPLPALISVWNVRRAEWMMPRLWFGSYAPGSIESVGSG